MIPRYVAVQSRRTTPLLLTPIARKADKVHLKHFMQDATKLRRHFPALRSSSEQGSHRRSHAGRTKMRNPL